MSLALDASRSALIHGLGIVPMPVEFGEAGTER
jgi:hypothetical protein